MEQFYREFEETLQKVEREFDKNNIENSLWPVKSAIMKQKLKKATKLSILLGAICALMFYLDCLDTASWHLCGVSRIIMIKLLPIYDWTKWAHTKCLLSKHTSESSNPSESFSRIDWQDCKACEHFETIDVLENISFDFIRDSYLVRGLPLIVSDSFKNFNKTESLEHFIENISLRMTKMLQSEPCSFKTNLMLSRLASLDNAFILLKKYIDISHQSAPPWFISFRNCKFEALKASRLMMRKPYFYPRTLHPPESSWLLLSQSFEGPPDNLKLDGLIIITQTKGLLKVILKARDICISFCRDLQFSIHSGESLVFLTDLWTFSYQFVADESFSVTFITETDFQSGM